MTRMSVSLTKIERDHLEKEAKRLGVSAAEVVRRLVEEDLRRQTQLPRSRAAAMRL